MTLLQRIKQWFKREKIEYEFIPNSEPDSTFIISAPSDSARNLISPPDIHGVQSQFLHGQPDKEFIL